MPSKHPVSTNTWRILQGSEKFTQMLLPNPEQRAVLPFPVLVPPVLGILFLPASLSAFNLPLPILSSVQLGGSCLSACSSPSPGKTSPLGSCSNSCLTSYCPIFPLEKCSPLPPESLSNLFSVIPLEELSLRSLTASQSSGHDHLPFDTTTPGFPFIF